MERKIKTHNAKYSVIYIGGYGIIEYPGILILINIHMPVATFVTFGKTIPNSQISSQLPFVSHPIPYSKKAYDHYISTP